MIMESENQTKPRVFADFSIDAILKTNTTTVNETRKSVPWGNVQHSAFPLLEIISEKANITENCNDHYNYCKSVSNGVCEEISTPTHSREDVEKLTFTVSDDEREDTDIQQVSKKSNDQRDSSAERTYAWLTCTRFKPPKLPRPRKKNTSRRHGRGPRIPFSTHQLAVLENTFVNSQYLSSDAICRLAETLNLTETRVKIWFQNRRARFRREKDSSSYIVDPRAPSMQNPPVEVEYDHCSYHNQLTCSTDSSTSKQHKESFRHLINDLNLMAANAATVNINSKAIFYNLDQCKIAKRST